MAGIWRILVGSVAVFCLADSSTNAFHGRFGLRPSPSSSNYYAPSYSYYCPPVPVAPLAFVPLTVAPARGTIYAVPSAAPPSQTIEPPLQQPPIPPAKVSEDVRLEVMVKSSRPAATPNELCRVGFWNLSGRDRRLMIDGKTWTVPKDRAIALDLPRHFAWQMEERGLRAERVPDGQATHEVVIRE